MHLKEIADVKGSDYINASFIDVRVYIVALQCTARLFTIVAQDWFPVPNYIE